MVTKSWSCLEPFNDAPVEYQCFPSCFSLNFDLDFKKLAFIYDQNISQVTTSEELPIPPLKAEGRMGILLSPPLPPPPLSLDPNKDEKSQTMVP